MNTNRLRAEIVANYRTQSAFAKKIGWRKNKVSRMLCGKYQPDVNEAATLATLLRLDDTTFCNIFLREPSPNGDN